MDLAEGHVTTAGHWMRQAPNPPSPHSLSQLPLSLSFFFYLRPQTQTNKQTQLANDTGLAMGWSKLTLTGRLMSALKQ